MKFAIYLLVRMSPMVALKKKIRNRFILSFLHYIPYAVLSVMTVPAIFSATEEPLAAVAGFAVACLLPGGRKVWSQWLQRPVRRFFLFSFSFSGRRRHALYPAELLGDRDSEWPCSFGAVITQEWYGNK